MSLNLRDGEYEIIFYLIHSSYFLILFFSLRIL